MPTMRNYRGYGGGGGFSLGFPPFTRAIKWLAIINAVVFLLQKLKGAAAPGRYNALIEYGALIPYLVTHGYIYQVISYSFLHSGLFHILFNMLTLWMFGSTLESNWGRNAFLQFYFFCVIGAALVTIAVSYAGTAPALSFLGIGPFTATIGASGGIYGVMVAFAMLYGNKEFMMFPLPFLIRAKYLVGILIFISLAGAFQGMGVGRGSSIAYFAHLGGAFFGWFYVRFLPRRGLGYLLSEQYFGTRNAYYRWKRRQAARKFEVYMKQQDRSQYFDEYGNYRDPNQEPHDKGNDEHRGPWVN